MSLIEGSSWIAKPRPQWLLLLCPTSYPAISIMAAIQTASDRQSLADIPDNLSVSFLPKGPNLSNRALQRGLNYYMQGYIHKIEVSNKSADLTRVDARCWRPMQKSQPPHQLQIEIKLDENKITESFCSCKAGMDGHCSHIVGLIKSLQGLKLHNFSHVPDQQSCTSLPQQWHIPRGDKISPVPINHVVVARPAETRKRRPILCQFDINYRLPGVSSSDISLLQGLTGTPIHCLSSNIPTISTCHGEVQIGSVLSYQTKNVKRRRTVVQQQTCGDLTVNGPAPVKLPVHFKPLNCLDENTDLVDLEHRTRGQADCEKWLEERATRLTSSNFGKVLKRKADPTDKFLESLFPLKSIKAAPLEYGKRNESRAKTEFLRQYPQKHLHECGFIVNREFDFLGTTPDGKICDNSESGIIEVKCPFKARQCTIREACEQFKDFCLDLNSQGHIGLKKSHDYYAQIQGQLMITGCKFCEFIVFTQKDLHVERILPNLEFMEDMLSKLALFFKNFAVPFLNKRKS